MIYKYSILQIPIVCLFILFPYINAQSAEFLTEEHTLQSNNGYFTLNWSSNTEKPFILERATNADFNDAITIYHGPDKSRFVSGLKNGTYFYRIREENNNLWSKTLEVQVHHPSLTLALSLFSVGAIVFCITVVVIIKGSKASNAKIGSNE